MKSFRTQVTFPAGAATGATGYVLLLPDSYIQVLGGVYGCYRGSDHEVAAIDPADRVGVLKWMATQEDDNGDWTNECTELCTVTPGVCYEVTASFSGKDDDGLMTATVTVTPRGQPPSATHSIRCRASDLDAVQIYNFNDGEAHVGDVEVEYETGETFRGPRLTRFRGAESESEVDEDDESEDA